MMISKATVAPPSTPVVMAPAFALICSMASSMYRSMSVGDRPSGPSLNHSVTDCTDSSRASPSGSIPSANDGTRKRANSAITGTRPTIVAQVAKAGDHPRALSRRTGGLSTDAANRPRKIGSTTTLTMATARNVM